MIPAPDDRLLEQVLAWTRSQLKPVELMTAEEKEAERPAALAAARVLKSDAGRELLTVIASFTVLRPALDPRLSGPASHDYAQRRAGENQVFAALIHLLDLAADLERTSRDRSRNPDPDPAPVFGWGGPASLFTDPDNDPRDRAGPDADFGQFEFDPGGDIAGG